MINDDLRIKIIETIINQTKKKNIDYRSEISMLNTNKNIKIFDKKQKNEMNQSQNSYELRVEFKNKYKKDKDLLCTCLRCLGSCFDGNVDDK